MSDPKLPTSLRIGPFDYTVGEFADLEANAINRYGDCNKVLHRIRVDTEHGPLQTMDTLLHEITHAILSEYIWNQNDDEERTVAVVATGFTQVYRDNPYLVEFIAHSIK